MFGTLANLGRDVAIAAAFGTALNVDAFFLALALPIFILTVGTAAFRSVIVPLLERTAHVSGNESALSVISHFLVRNIAAVLAVAALLAITVPLYAPLLAGKLPSHAAHSIVLFTWAALPMMVISGYAMLTEGPLQTRGQFLLPGIARMGLPLGIAAGAIFLGPTHGIFGACIGGALGSLIQLTISFVALSREGLISKARDSLDRDVVAESRKQFLMLAVGMSIVYISPVINQWMASFLGAGSVSILSYANRLAVGVSALTIGSLGPVLLPYFSRIVAQGNTKSLNNAYVEFVRLSLWAGFGLAGVIWLLSAPVITILFESGNFTRADSYAVANILGWLCLQFPPLLTSTAGFTLISAVNLNKWFIPMSTLNAAVNLAANIILMRLYGLAGIAIATGLTYAVSLITMNLVLYKKDVIRLPLSLAVDFLFSAGTAAILGVVLVILHGKPDANPSGQQLALSMLALVVYFAVAFGFTRRLIRRIVNIPRAA